MLRTSFRNLALMALASVALPGIAGQDPGQAPIYAAYTSELGASNVREVRLLIDGRDVTTAATVTPLRVSYAPSEPLAAGIHSARVVVVDAVGRTWAKDWSFTVEGAEPALDDEVWSRELLVELKRPPRQTRERVLTLTGWTQPGAEVIVRLDGSEAARALASISGRFAAELELPVRDNALTVSARRLENGDEGPEIALRVERVRVAAGDDDDDVVTRPPQRRIPVPRVGPPRSQTASGQPREMPRTEAPRQPSRREPVSKAPTDGGPLNPTAPEIAIPEMPGEEPVAVVVITKPRDGEVIEPGHATVLGRAPAGWDVTLLVDGRASGSDEANPAGRFTIPNVQLASGDHELVAEAAGDGRVLRSEPVTVTVQPRFQLGPELLALSTPQRASSVARSSVQRVSGTAWDGAEVEIEVNGRIVAREIAGLGGRFDVDVPLENGLNVLLVEASSADGDRMARSREYAVSAASRAGLAARDTARLERIPRAPVTGTRGGRGPGPAAPVGLP